MEKHFTVQLLKKGKHFPAGRQRYRNIPQSVEELEKSWTRRRIYELIFQYFTDIEHFQSISFQDF